MTIAITCNCGNSFAADADWSNRLIACPVCNDLLAVSAGAAIATERTVGATTVLPEGAIQLRLLPGDEVFEAPVECVEEPADDGPDTYNLSRLQHWQTHGAAGGLYQFWAGVGVIGLQDSASCLAYGPFNQSGLAGCGIDVQILNMRAGARGRVFTNHESAVTALAIAADGRSALSGDAGGDLFWWDLTDGATTQRVRAHLGSVSALAIAPDGNLAISGGSDGGTRIWDLSCGCHAFPIANPGLRGEITAVAFSTDGRFFLSGDADGRIDVWAADTGTFLLSLLASEPIACVRCFEGMVTAVMTPIASEVASHPSVLRWEAASGRPLPCFAKALAPQIIADCVSLDRDGRRLLIAGRAPAFQHVPYPLAVPLIQMREGVRDFFGIREAAERSGTLEVWSLATGACLHAFPPFRGGIHCLAISPDNNRILASSSDANLHVFAMPYA